MSKIEEICKHYDVKFSFDRFSAKMTFKDGKYLKYAMLNGGLNQDIIFEKLLSMVENNEIHGRVFNKDGNFIGYAPKTSNIDTLLVSVDMMV